MTTVEGLFERLQRNSQPCDLLQLNRDHSRVFGVGGPAAEPLPFLERARQFLLDGIEQLQEKWIGVSHGSRPAKPGHAIQAYRMPSVTARLSAKNARIVPVRARRSPRLSQTSRRDSRVAPGTEEAEAAVSAS